MNMYTPILLVIALGLIVAILGFTIGRIEKARLERKQDHIEYLNKRQQEHLHREQNDLARLKKEKQQYERLLAEMDHSSIPTKEQIKKLHWYMNQFGYIDIQNMNQLNQFYSKNYPENPFK